MSEPLTLSIVANPDLVEIGQSTVLTVGRSGGADLPNLHYDAPIAGLNVGQYLPGWSITGNASAWTRGTRLGQSALVAGVPNQGSAFSQIARPFAPGYRWSARIAGYAGDDGLRINGSLVKPMYQTGPYDITLTGEDAFALTIRADVGTDSSNITLLQVTEYRAAIFGDLTVGLQPPAGFVATPPIPATVVIPAGASTTNLSPVALDKHGTATVRATHADASADATDQVTVLARPAITSAIVDPNGWTVRVTWTRPVTASASRPATTIDRGDRTDPAELIYQSTPDNGTTLVYQSTRRVNADDIVSASIAVSTTAAGQTFAHPSISRTLTNQSAVVRYKRTASVASAATPAGQLRYAKKVATTSAPVGRIVFRRSIRSSAVTTAARPASIRGQADDQANTADSSTGADDIITTLRHPALQSNATPEAERRNIRRPNAAAQHSITGPAAERRILPRIIRSSTVAAQSTPTHLRGNDRRRLAAAGAIASPDVDSIATRRRSSAVATIAGPASDRSYVIRLSADADSQAAADHSLTFARHSVINSVASPDVGSSLVLQHQSTATAHVGSQAARRNRPQIKNASPSSIASLSSDRTQHRFRPAEQTADLSVNAKRHHRIRRDATTTSSSRSVGRIINTTSRHSTTTTKLTPSAEHRLVAKIRRQSVAATRSQAYAERSLTFFLRGEGEPATVVSPQVDRKHHKFLQSQPTTRSSQYGDRHHRIVRGSVVTTRLRNSERDIIVRRSQVATVASPVAERRIMTSRQAIVTTLSDNGRPRIVREIRLRWLDVILPHLPLHRSIIVVQLDMGAPVVDPRPVVTVAGTGEPVPAWQRQSGKTDRLKLLIQPPVSDPPADLILITSDYAP